MARIVLVEDEQVLLASTARVLEKAGHEVVPASNGLEAIAIIEAQPPDLVVTDISMPDMDGIEVILGLRSDGPTYRSSSFRGAGDWPPVCCSTTRRRWARTGPFRSSLLHNSFRPWYRSP